MPPPPPYGGPYGATPYGSASPAPPPPAFVQGAPPPPPLRPLNPATQIPPETLRLAKKLGYLNIALSLAHLGASVAIIGLIRYNLEDYSVRQSQSGDVVLSYSCLMGPPSGGASSSTSSAACSYAYTTAAGSVLASFVLSLAQCLSRDCAGRGRVIEAAFDLLLAAWWAAAGISLGNSAAAANRAGAPEAGARNAVVALCWVAAAVFLALLASNGLLAARVGKYLRAQRAEALAAHNPANAPGAVGVQMAPMPPMGVFGGWGGGGGVGGGGGGVAPGGGRPPLYGDYYSQQPTGGAQPPHVVGYPVSAAQAPPPPPTIPMASATVGAGVAAVATAAAPPPPPPAPAPAPAPPAPAPVPPAPAPAVAGQVTGGSTGARAPLANPFAAAPGRGTAAAPSSSNAAAAAAMAEAAQKTL
jgi:hypothetical protein